MTPPPPGLDLSDVAAAVPGQQAPPQQMTPPPPGLDLSGEDQQPVSQTTPQQQQRGPFSPLPQAETPEQQGATAAHQLSPFWGYEESLSAGFAGFTGNLTNRLDAAAHAGFAALTGKDVGKTFDERLRADQAYVDTLQKEYPITSLGGNLLGLLGFGFAVSPAAPKVIASLGVPGRIAWQGLIGSGQLAFLNYAQAQGGLASEERKNAAETGAWWGAGLGLAGGALGEALTKGANWMFGKPVSAAAQAAMKETGIARDIPAAEQSEKVLGALQHYGPVAQASELFAAGVPAIEKAAQGAEDIHTSALDMLRSSISRRAQFSTDAIGAVVQDMTRRIDEEGVNLSYAGLSGTGKEVLNILNTLQGKAATAPGGVPFKEVIDAYKQINTLFRKGDPVVPAAQHAFKKWISNAFDANLISGDARALPEWENYLKAFSEFKDHINPATSLGNVIGRALRSEDISNWIDNISATKTPYKGAEFAQGLKDWIGESSKEWVGVRNAGVAKLLNLKQGQLEAGRLNPEGLAKGIDRLLGSPASRVLLNPDEIQHFEQVRLALRNLPDAAPYITRMITDWQQKALEGTLGTFSGGIFGAHEYLSQPAESRDPLRALFKTIEFGALGFMAPKAVAPILRGASRIVPEAIRTGAAPVGGALYRSMRSPTAVQPSGQRRGGVAKLAVKRAHASAREYLAQE